MKLLKLIFFACGCIFSMALTAQEFSHNFGAVGMDELTWKSYKYDVNADAVVMYDIGKTTFIPASNGFDIMFIRHARIKIFKKSGFENATIEVPLYESGNTAEIFQDLKAFTYNEEDGKIKKTPLDLNTVFQEKISDDISVKKFTFPELKEGSVIEFQYTVISPFMFNLPSWEFQDEIPTILSDYTVLMIPFYEYTFVLQGATKFDKYETYKIEGLPKSFGGVSYNEMFTHFAMEDVPAFKKEPFITSKNDYLVKINFQLSKVINTDGVQSDIITTWDKLGKELIKDSEFGKYMSNCQNLARDVFNMPGDPSGDEKTRVLSVVKDVKALVRWNGHYGKYAHKSAKNFLAEKSGNVAEVNLFLAAAMNAAGLEAHPVLISTRSHGQIKADYPFIHYFNYVAAAVKVKDQWLLCDATEPSCPDAGLPPRCLNGKGLLVFKDKTAWIDLLPAISSNTGMEFTVEPKPGKDSADAIFSLNYTGYDAFSIKDETRNKQDELLKYFRSEQIDPYGKIESFNYEDPEKNYVLNFRSLIPVENLDGKLIVSPVPSDFLPGTMFPEADRKLPVNMSYPLLRTFTCHVIIPEGYKLTKLPDDFFRDDDLMKISYSSRIDGNQVHITAMWGFKRTFYLSQEYINLRLHFIDINSTFNQKIIMVKN
jgi:hypothetical protein